MKTSVIFLSDERHGKPAHLQKKDDEEEEDLNESNYDEVLWVPCCVYYIGTPTNCQISIMHNQSKLQGIYNSETNCFTVYQYDQPSKLKKWASLVKVV